MKKALKSAISVFVVFAILFSLTSVSFAQSEEHCDQAPVVFVGGIGAPLYITEPDGTQRQAFIPPTDKIVFNVLMLLPFIPLAMLSGSWEVLADAVSVAASRVFEDIKCDENGDSYYDVGTFANNMPDISVHENPNNNKYTFNYDWRLDPVENAQYLDEYIDEVIEVTGHSKVILEGFSEGGEVSFAYLATYGCGKIEKYIALNSAFQGLNLIGELFSNNIGVNGNQLYNFVSTILPSAGVSDAVINLMKVLKFTGVFAILGGILGIVVDNCYEEVYRDFAVPYFACMPGVACFIPAEHYDAAVEAAFGGKRKYDGLVAKLDRYHNYQVNAKQILDGLVEQGMSIVVISCHCGYPMPFVGDKVYLSDGLIDTARSSGGATTAPMGKPFGSDYVQKVNCGHNHVSSDFKIDASTCMYPEYTWFISEANHWNNMDEISRWAENFNGQPTVRSDAKYPQFL